MPTDPQPSADEALLGLTGLSARPPERVPIRARSGTVTQSAWRLEVTSELGGGSIVLVEISDREAYYRGEGVFLGWSQDRLALAYKALLPRLHEGPVDVPQLG